MKNNAWAAELETGLSALDLDNKALRALIERVIEASETANLPGLKSSLTDLQAATIARFEREEQLMDAFQYESAASHRAEHAQLSAEIQSMRDGLAAGEAGAAYIGRFMRNWLVQHIVSKDALFREAVLTQNGTTDRRQNGVDTPMPDDEMDIFEERRLENLKPILWTSKIALGIDDIDDGHRAMFGLFDAILAARKSADRAKLATLLEQLGNATAAHFQSEERLMAKCNYEHKAAHDEEHRKVLNEFAYQVDDWREDHISAELLCRFMHRWLLRHIAAWDIPLGEAVSRQGARPAQP